MSSSCAVVGSTTSSGLSSLVHTVACLSSNFLSNTSVNSLVDSIPALRPNLFNLSSGIPLSNPLSYKDSCQNVEPPFQESDIEEDFPTFKHWPGMINLTDLSEEMVDFLNRDQAPTLLGLPNSGFEVDGSGLIIFNHFG